MLTHWVRQIISCRLLLPTPSILLCSFSTLCTKGSCTALSAAQLQGSGLGDCWLCRLLQNTFEACPFATRCLILGCLLISEFYAGASQLDQLGQTVSSRLVDRNKCIATRSLCTVFYNKDRLVASRRCASSFRTGIRPFHFVPLFSCRFWVLHLRDSVILRCSLFLHTSFCVLDEDRERTRGVIVKIVKNREEIRKERSTETDPGCHTLLVRSMFLYFILLLYRLIFHSCLVYI